MKLAIVTGVSKGLGESLATVLLESGINVIGISRSENDHLKEIANRKNMSYEHFAYDLMDVASLDEQLGIISKSIFKEKLEKIYVINNAAVVEPINQAIKINSQELIDHVNINTIAPMIILNYFLKSASQFSVPLIGVTVTSGAAERAVFGWSAYCSTKASINMYTKTVALELDEMKTDHKVIAFSPGIMDTEMQGSIRSSSKEAFREVADFIAYKKDNQLNNAQDVANVLISLILKDNKIENGKIYHVKDYL